MSVLPVVVVLLHHVSSHPLPGSEADTAEERDTQHVPVLKTRVTWVAHFLLNGHNNYLIPRTPPGITGSGQTHTKAKLEPDG